MGTTLWSPFLRSCHRATTTRGAIVPAEQRRNARRAAGSGGQVPRPKATPAVRTRSQASEGASPAARRATGRGATEGRRQPEQGGGPRRRDNGERGRPSSTLGERGRPSSPSGEGGRPASERGSVDGSPKRLSGARTAGGGKARSLAGGAGYRADRPDSRPARSYAKPAGAHADSARTAGSAARPLRSRPAPAAAGAPRRRVAGSPAAPRLRSTEAASPPAWPRSAGAAPANAAASRGRGAQPSLATSTRATGKTDSRSPRPATQWPKRADAAASRLDSATSPAPTRRAARPDSDRSAVGARRDGAARERAGGGAAGRTARSIPPASGGPRSAAGRGGGLPAAGDRVPGGRTGYAGAGSARPEPRRDRPAEPPLPAEATPALLASDVRRELSSLAPDNATRVGAHLAAAALLLAEEPKRAYAHAMFAKALGGRIGVVREAAGIAAYHAGEFASALAELRAARRITGEFAHLAVMADCERALGRPDRALAVVADPDANRLPKASRVELAIVGSGARRDLGQAAAAVVSLQGPDLDADSVSEWSPRLWYAYADALLAAGRTAEARQWFEAVASIDDSEETDAVERLDAL